MSYILFLPLCPTRYYSQNSVINFAARYNLSATYRTITELVILPILSLYDAN